MRRSASHGHAKILLEYVMVSHLDDIKTSKAPLKDALRAFCNKLVIRKRFLAYSGLLVYTSIRLSRCVTLIPTVMPLCLAEYFTMNESEGSILNGKEKKK